MDVVALDTNILLDYFFQREANFKLAKDLLTKSERGKLIIFIPLPVILEYEWVVRSVYQRDKKDIMMTIEYLLDIPNCEVPEKALVRRAVDLYKKSRGVNFDDCIIALTVKAAKVSDFVTSDRKLKKLYQKL